MLKRNWFPDFNGTRQDLYERTEEILGPLLFPGGKDCRELNMAARQNLRRNSAQDDHALWAWQAKVLQLSNEQNVGEYDPEAMTADFMRSVLTLSRLDDGPVQARKLLARNGVATVLLHHLPATHLDGAAMLRSDGHPVIALTLRHDRLDNFWFTLAHELAHVVLHLAKGEVCAFLDDLEANPGKDKLETAADRCASDILLPMEDADYSRFAQAPTPARIREIALRNHVHTAVVAGRIRYEQRNYRLLTKWVGSGTLRKIFPDYKQGDFAVGGV